MAMLASHLQLKSQDNLRDMSSAVLQALRLRAIVTMEHGEYNVLVKQAKRAEQNVMQHEQNAKILNSSSHVDMIWAERSRKRGQYFESLAVEEQNETDLMWTKVQQMEVLRAALVANLTADIEQEKHLEELQRQQQQQSDDDEWPVFRLFRRTFGGPPGLVKHPDDELHQMIAQIVQETQELNFVEKVEFIEYLAALFLQGKTDQYNQTATDLLRLANVWELRSEQDKLASIQESETAMAYKSQQERIESQMHKDESWERNNEQAAKVYWSQAEFYGQRASRYGRFAAILAVASLMFFLPKLCYSARSLSDTMMKQQQQRGDGGRGCDILWNVSYCVQHVIVFLLVVGMMDDTNSLLHLADLDIPKRAATIVWFAYLGAGLQTILLHTIPHCMALRPMDCDSWYEISLQFFLHLMALILFYAMEFLIVWITIRKFVFTSDNVQQFSSWEYYFYFVLVVVIHLCLLEPRAGVPTHIHVNGSGEQSTVATSDDDDDESDDILDTLSQQDSPTTESFLSTPFAYFRRTTTAMASSSHRSNMSPTPTETSPLQSGGGDNVSASPTENMPLVFLGNTTLLPNQRSTIVGGTSGSSSQQRMLVMSPYALNIDRECATLSAALEILLIVCSVCVLKNGVLHGWWHGMISSWIVAVAMVLLVGVAVVLFPRRRGGGGDSSFAPINTLRVDKLGYVSIMDV